MFPSRQYPPQPWQRKAEQPARRRNVWVILFGTPLGRPALRRAPPFPCLPSGEGSDENSTAESSASGGGRYCFIDDLSGPIPRRADAEPPACLLARQRAHRYNTHGHNRPYDEWFDVFCASISSASS